MRLSVSHACRAADSACGEGFLSSDPKPGGGAHGGAAAAIGSRHASRRNSTPQRCDGAATRISGRAVALMGLPLSSSSRCNRHHRGPSMRRPPRWLGQHFPARVLRLSVAGMPVQSRMPSTRCGSEGRHSSCGHSSPWWPATARRRRWVYRPSLRWLCAPLRRYRTDGATTTGVTREWTRMVGLRPSATLSAW